MRKQISPKDFTKVVGSYSHALEVELGENRLIFVTGQIAMDQEGRSVAPGDIKKQTVYIFENIKKILEEADSSIDDVVKATIFVTDMSKFKEISNIRNDYFKTCRPASTLVEINRTIKEGCDVEIEVVAVGTKQ